ncbi:TolC family protein [Azonexus caeni]|jgi:cobalt-zinc-cadmium efflux system outer membrane protein|uniref:TolC family protein n=1 Tax=Azonexus caeni TaxID=266126 RepID=UPI003A8C7E33
MRPVARILVLLALLPVTPVGAETVVTLPQAFAAAWTRHSLSQTLPLQREAVAARRDAAAAWTPEPAAIEIGGRSDRFNADRGAEEIELGLALPLWLPGERQASQALAEAEGARLEGRAAAQRLQLAGELRSAWWEWRLARDEVALSDNALDSARRLRDDVARRVAAGDLARADLHQAAAALALAQAEQADVAVRLEAAAARLQWLTGQRPAALNGDGEAAPAKAVEADWLSAHPELQAAQARFEQARQAQALARSRSRANPELTVSTRRERGASGEAAERSWALGLRIPLSSSARHGAAIAEAGAERVEAEIDLERERERLQQTAQLARSQWQAAERRRQASEERAQLARETQRFFDKAFRLGESDLPTRLRIGQETFAAERAANRARIQESAALSAYRQALGLLPE